MQLVSLEAKNFRSLEHVCLKFGRLAVLIGENDAGKSSTLDLLEIALSNRAPDESDFFCREEESEEDGIEGRRKCETDNIEAILEFRLDDNDNEAKPFAINSSLKVRKIWKIATSETFYWGREIVDPQLAQDFTKLKKPELEAIIQVIDPAALPNLRNNEERIDWLQQKANEAPTKDDWIAVTGRWGEFLPRFERYKAMDYSSPENLVRKTLLQVFEQCIYREVEKDGQVVKYLDKRLDDVRKDADIHIRDKVQELKVFIKRYAPQIKNISYKSLIDFSGGLKSGEFQVDDGRGLHYLSKVGDGTKRRISMATLEWDREVSMQQAAKGTALPTILRGYDEPDTNLHYEAQRLMYHAITDIAEAPNSHIQIIICTHSLTMIDRASAKSINLLRLKNGCTSVERLETDDDPSIERFLHELAQELGITNTIMFYEKCFVLVEGETEINALPIFYRTLYKRSLLEDGIRIINVKGNGATKEFLKLISRNKQSLTLTLLDKDSEDENRGEIAKLTRGEFKEAGFSDEFITSRMLYIGTKEFEDAFTNDVLARSLQQGFPKLYGTWTTDDIKQIRGDRKISDAIGRLVHENASPDSPKWGKPELGKCLGRTCNETDIPREVVNLFELARQVSGCC